MPALPRQRLLNFCNFIESVLSNSNRRQTLPQWPQLLATAVADLPDLSDFPAVARPIQKVRGIHETFHDKSSVWKKLVRETKSLRQAVEETPGNALLEALYWPDRVPQTTSKPSTSHSEDFTSVVWFDQSYTFAKGLQAECVRALWEAWRDGGHSLSEMTIGNKAGSDNSCFRLYHIFNPTRDGKRKPHPAWGSMIQRAGKGTFHLVPPAGFGITR